MSFQAPTLLANTMQSNSEKGYVQAFPDSCGTAREHVSSTSPCYIGFEFGNDDIASSHIYRTREILHAPISLSGSGSPQQHAAYWYCCQQDHMNSYALAPERCSLCPHFRCANCADA